MVRKSTTKRKRKKPLTAAQKAVRNKMKLAAKKFKAYQRKNPNGKRKITSFVKEVFKKKR